MQSIEKKILTNVAKCGSGKIIFSQDFASYGTPNAVHMAKVVPIDVYFSDSKL